MENLFWLHNALVLLRPKSGFLERDSLLREEPFRECRIFSPLCSGVEACAYLAERGPMFATSAPKCGHWSGVKGTPSLKTMCSTL